MATITLQGKQINTNGELPKIISMPKRTAHRKEILAKMQKYEPKERFDKLSPNLGPTEIKLRVKLGSLEDEVEELEKK